MPGAHAKLSPSSAERWISCPPSVRMIEEHTDPSRDEDSVYAREGTLAHALGELAAGLEFKLITKRQYNRGLKAWEAEFDAMEYPEGTRQEMEGHVGSYVELIRERLARVPGAVLFLEQRMDSGVPRCWGTSDAVIVSPEHIEIIDLKYGAGVFVSAHENYQLNLYGLGALDTYGDMIDTTERIYMTVFQPRMDNVSTADMHPDELRAWRSEVAVPAAELALSDDPGEFGPSEKACRWCPVAAICRARVDAAIEEAFGEDFLDEPIPEEAPKPEVLTDAELGAALERVPFITAWLKALEEYALEKAYGRGEPIPGHKVVMSGGRRAVTDATAAIQTLIDKGYKAEQVADFKVKPLGQLEKLVGKKELPEILGDLLKKGEGRPSLVPESDPRQPVSREGDAAAAFDAEDLV